MPPFVSTSAVVVRDGALLVILDPIRTQPVLPGGHVKWREKPEMALAREVSEETGYDVDVGALIGVFCGEEWTSEPGIVRIVYAAEIRFGELRSSHEGEAMWVAVDEFLTSSVRDAPIVRAYVETISAPSTTTKD